LHRTGPPPSQMGGRLPGFAESGPDFCPSIPVSGKQGPYSESTVTSTGANVPGLVPVEGLSRAPSPCNCCRTSAAYCNHCSHESRVENQACTDQTANKAILNGWNICCCRCTSAAGLTPSFHSLSASSNGRASTSPTSRQLRLHRERICASTKVRPLLCVSYQYTPFPQELWLKSPQDSGMCSGFCSITVCQTTFAVVSEDLAT
jgi:hypothetical protein